MGEPHLRDFPYVSRQTFHNPLDNPAGHKKSGPKLMYIPI